MKLSYCITCHTRLWQLRQTLSQNVYFTKVGEVEICILAYNDDTIEPYINEHYPQQVADGRIVVKSHNDDYVPKDGSDFACGHVKNLSHEMGVGEVLFNLDADNFITHRLHNELLELQEDQILMLDPRTVKPDGRSGRIGIHSTKFKRLRGYRDEGRSDDLDFIRRAFLLGLKAKYTICDVDPLPNVQEG